MSPPFFYRLAEKIQELPFLKIAKTAPQEPIRAELFSIERLEQHAESLAHAQAITLTPSKKHAILRRVKENGRTLRAAHASMTHSIKNEHAITPAAEWLVDNFYVIEEQILEIADDLPPEFYRKLPKLKQGFLEGAPRIYGVAWSYVAHTDSRFDPEWLRRFIRAYQRVSPLHIGELWALAISLRIVLVENLRRLTDRLIASKSEQSRADSLADSLLSLKNPKPESIHALLNPFGSAPLEKSFAVQLVLRLQDQGEGVSSTLNWLDQRLHAQGRTAEELVRLEHQEQASMNTSVRNVITSMRLVSALDWSQFFEDISVTDEILRAESNFSALDFQTRDLYRHAIEELACESNLSEIEITRRVVQKAKNASASQRSHDPGYFLIAQGRIEFENEIHCRVSLQLRFFRAYISKATFVYLGTVSLIATGLMTLPLWLSWQHGISLTALIALAFAALIPASDSAIALVNGWVTRSMGPKPLPKLDFKKGIPSEFKTLVTMPTLLTDSQSIEEMLERLEIHYLSNPEGYLQFSLLTDWADAQSEESPEDRQLLTLTQNGVKKLNDRYGQGPDKTNRFFLFHRKRVWNASEKIWMGWERKRGKLQELNHLLRGSKQTSFINLSAPEFIPQKIRYIITLDADTRMAQGTAYQLVGAMAHPLNRPLFDPKAGRIVEGYGIIQPRITPTLPTAGEGSFYQRIFSGPSGIDPYAFAVSDVYQDLFREGSYIGKGIYDLDAFESSLAGRIPENSVLSHDLFEGLHARAALATDIELFEEFPSHYEVAASRAHRWARGDWQLMPWIAGRTSRADNTEQSAPLPFIGRWKMMDNLRRSLSAPTLLLTLLFSWSFPSAPAGIWLVFILTVLFLVPMQHFLSGLMAHRKKIPLRRYFQAASEDFSSTFFQIFLGLVFLAYQASLMTDAVTRTLYRILISHKKMLEWTSAALTKKSVRYDISDFYRRMSAAPLIAVLVSLIPFACHTRERLGIILPFAFLWILSPWIARLISLPIQTMKHQETATAEDRHLFRKTARKTWLFFETFVTPADHFLPPDNFQEIPEPVVAHRTSPTNIGLYLLSAVAAYDFGWIGRLKLAEKLEATLQTLKCLKKHKGHLFNWYDTLSLEPLPPAYISTVDSGNLAGHLWTLAGACRQLRSVPLFRGDMLNGFRDVFSLIMDALPSTADQNRTESVTESQLKSALETLRDDLSGAPVTSAEWNEHFAILNRHTSTLVDIARALTPIHATPAQKEFLEWSEILLRQIHSHAHDFKSITTESSEISGIFTRLTAIAESCDALVSEMEFKFLIDPTKKIFSIGYQVAEKKLDPGCYDLLTSEARLASFVAIAKGDIPALHWFRLTRSLTSADHTLLLVSWSGSMFEYLMPLLVMRSPPHSLLDQTCRRAVERQISYGNECGVPWGISESAYNVQNLHHTYQYSNFGVPGLGLKRGLAENLVIAPYATALAAILVPSQAAKNYADLENLHAGGKYGFFEALDFTPSRLPENQKVAVVRAYMAHHQGMTIIALANVVYKDIFRTRFHAEPKVQASDLLLQERTPRTVTVVRTLLEESRHEILELNSGALRHFHSPHDVLPRTHLLSNGSYSVMITAAGSGYSHWRDIAVTRWREDTTRDAMGTYIFFRDIKTMEVWSAGYQPTAAEPDKYEIDFSEDRAEMIRQDDTLETTTEVVVSPEDDAEIRRVTIKNKGLFARVIDITSYAEMVLAPQAADVAHPAFSNLFIQTEFVPEINGLLCNRRARSDQDASPWVGHVLVVEGRTEGQVQYESNRARFLGRGRGIRNAVCITDGNPLSNNADAGMDPIVSLRCRVHILPGEKIRATFTTVISASRAETMELADKYHDPAMFERTVTLAWTHAHIQQHHLAMQPSEAHLFQDLASRIIYSHAGLRPSPNTLKLNRLGQSGLWPHGVSGDFPVVLIRINENDDEGILRHILRAHAYWRMKNLAVDLVILNEKAASYAQDFQSSLENLVHTAQSVHKHENMNPRGGIFVLRADTLTADEVILLRTAARITLQSRYGSLAQQIERLEQTDLFEAPQHRKTKRPSVPNLSSKDASQLLFFNGLGGFSADGSEYIIHLGTDQWTPTPWINVIANPHFGFQVSESGSGYSWAENSRENQITPWSNDPVCDSSGEIFYIRDDETGELWNPTALPIRGDGSYVICHGQGYSLFERQNYGISTELLQFVPVDDPVKISRLRVTNRSERPRTLSVTAYIEWALGSNRHSGVPFIITELDEKTDSILAKNPWNTEFAERTAFADFAGRQTDWTADRAEFLGRNGTLDFPAALVKNSTLSKKCGAGLDPCAAMKQTVELKPGQSRELVFLLGQGSTRENAIALIQHYRSANLDEKLVEVKKKWNDILTAVHVRTPDPSMDLLLNRWLLYQTLVCRMWARCGLYQAGGAFGFRDQLQDALALMVSGRDIAREQILRAAARQFPEGDVQHWWHPPSGRGVRTKISDDLAWMPYAVIHYLNVTGEQKILEEMVPFLESQAIPGEKEDLYYQPKISPQSATLYEHCARALDQCLRVGAHGLPLIGTGDWNDGMNRVGHEGKGESIWLAWFLHTTLWEFAKIAEARGDFSRAEKWRLHVGDLKTALEHHGWDGEWYRRAYFDDGTPLGSASNAECRIDSIAQSWGVISGAADPARAARSMASLKANLINTKDKLALLLAPPFDTMKPNAGYIQGYIPGVRENGGQYTHAGVWAVLAFAALGDGNTAAELFSILNPIHHGSTRAGIHRYKIEPYVMAGDVYAAENHVGRGGWSWYTGSAGWMYRAGIEWILGFRLRDNKLFMDPCIPPDWDGFELSFHYHASKYEVKVENPNHVARGIQLIEMDGKPARRKEGILLVKDSANHSIRIVLGS